MSDFDNLAKIEIKNSLDTAREEGFEEGRKKGSEEEQKLMVQNSLKAGLDIEVIVQISGLSIAQIEKLRQDLT